MSVAGRVRQGRGAVTTELGAPFLLGALSVALLAQGAYYLRAQLYVAALVGAALLVSAGLTGLTRSDRTIAFPVGGLASWAVFDAAVHHNLRTAVPYVALLAGVVTLLLACSRLDDPARDVLLAGLIGCGVLVALLGWLGLAFHLARWTWQGQGPWRASSTLTYPNATAIILAMLALLILSMLTQAPRSVPLVLAATVVITGLAATLSRAGLLAFAVGLVVLGAFLGPQLLLRAGGAAVLGAAVAVIGLVPAMTTRTPHAAAAVLALVAGLLISVTLTVIRLPRAAVNGLAVLMLILGVATVHTAIAAISDARMTVDDPERAASFRAAVEVFIHQPITGAGPSLPSLSWASDNGSSVYRYAHNEYLQVLAELGAIGGLLLAASLFMIIRRLYRARRGNAAVAAGALAATSALAVHAGFDFVWHIPAIPLLAAALVGLASPEVPAGRLSQHAGGTPEEESA